MSLLYYLESIREPILDGFFSLITQFGEETLFIVFGLLLFWCVNKKEGYYLLGVGLMGTIFNQWLKLLFRVPRPWILDPSFSIVESARAGATGYSFPSGHTQAMGTIFNQWLKLLFRVPRPWILDPSFSIVESARAGATGYSFPSGHTQASIGVYGAIARWTKRPGVRLLCIALCVLVPLSRMYLGVHTPWDVGVSACIALALVFALYPLVHNGCEKPRCMRLLFGGMTALAVGYLAFVHFYPACIALALVFALYPLVHNGCEKPRCMRLLFGGMTALAVGYLAFVHFYPFPADVDMANLAHGTKNAYTMLGSVLGVWLTWEMDRRFIHFDTDATLRVQVIKLLLGLTLLLGIKAGLKAPLRALLGGHYAADGLRYFLTVSFAGCIWPMTFPWLNRKFGRN